MRLFDRLRFQAPPPDPPPPDPEIEELHAESRRLTVEQQQHSRDVSDAADEVLALLGKAPDA